MMNEVTKDEQARQRRNDAIEKCRRQTSHARVRGGARRCGFVVYDPQVKADSEIIDKDLEWAEWWNREVRQ